MTTDINKYRFTEKRTTQYVITTHFYNFNILENVLRVAM